MSVGVQMRKFAHITNGNMAGMGNFYPDHNNLPMGDDSAALLPAVQKISDGTSNGLLLPAVQRQLGLMSGVQVSGKMVETGVISALIGLL